MSSLDSSVTEVPRVTALGPGELRVKVQAGASESVVALEGELDLETAPKLRSALSELLGADGSGDVVFDLAGLEFVDSTGLRVMVETVKQLRDRDCQLVLHRPQPSTLKVLEICGLAQTLKITAG